jgi:uncharacterized surface protein with fasciclin (FAS1) repeats
MKSIQQFIYVILGIFLMNSAYAQQAEKTVYVGGAPMYPSKNIIENAMNSKDHTTLVAAIKAAGLVETLEGPGPFTVFAPTNEAFNRLPAGTVDMWLKPENKDKLTSILTYHVVAGKWDAKSLGDVIMKGNGKAEIKTVQGGKIWAMMKGNKIMIKDETGIVATLSIEDIYQSNGVIFVIDRVLMPK